MAQKWEETLRAMQALGLTVHHTQQTPPLPEQDCPDRQAFATFINAAAAVRFSADPMKLPEARALLERDKVGKAKLVVAGFELEGAQPDDYKLSRASTAMITRLLRSRLEFSREQIEQLCQAWCKLDRYGRYSMPNGSFISAIERHLGGEIAPEPLRTTLQQVRRKLLKEHDAEHDKLAARVSELVDGKGPAAKAIFVDGTWGRPAQSWLVGTDKRLPWTALLTHCATASAGKPSGVWLRTAKPMVAAVGAQTAVDQLAEWAVEVPMGPPDGHGFSQAVDSGLQPQNADILKGFLWAISTVDHPALPMLLATFAARCFKKIPDWGPGAPKLGNAAVVALSGLPHHAGIAGLSRLLGTVKYGSARKTIERALDRAATAAGMSRDDLEELAVPDLGLSVDGVARIPIGDGQAVITVESGDAVLLRYERGDKVTKSAPKALAQADPGAVKAAKALRKEVAEALSGQAGRIERLLLADKQWTVATWRQRYVDHPLLSQIARRLIWCADGQALLWSDGWIDAAGEPVTVADSAAITLWHPLDHDAATVLAWRDRLEALEVQQPFKQAWREIYLVAPAELETATHSNRFAAHIVRQHPFAALCRDRSWAFTLMGQWDSHNTPTKSLPGGWGAELFVEFIEEDATTPNGIYLLISTDQVRFTRDGALVPMDQIPPRVFSEVMRDVDLFVAVCSVAVDEGWADRGPAEVQNYWNRAAFGDLSEMGRTRHAVLGRLLPKLKIADRCTLQPTWLHVKGQLQDYRIHLGSGNIQILPEQRYLCIVAGPSTGPRRLFLPFEGDRTLSLILSKAFLLAADDTIVDPSIVAQLGKTKRSTSE